MTTIDPATAAAIAENLREVLEHIAKTARAAGRDPDDVTLIAVSKSQPPERIEAALLAGYRIFGENRVQEAEGRWPALRARYPDLELHFIGHLQSNKAAEAVALFDVIQTIDRPKLARAVAKEMERQGRRPRILIEVNIGEEPQKGGVTPDELDALVALCRDELGLPLEGLMCIPPMDEDPAPYFALLASMAKRFGLETISMGMSADYEIAVRLGATHVRVGTAIFGERVPRH
jgi:pyridoxal phosphate enzyme (YggS family)